MAEDRVILVQEEPRGPSQLIEVPVPRSGLTKLQFPDIQQLRSDQTQLIVIKQMRLITLDVLTNGMIVGGANAPLTELKKISMVLYCEGWEKGQLIPLLTLNDVATPAGTFPHVYAPMRFNNWDSVDWSKSYIQYANGTASVAETPYVIMVDVLYTRFRIAIVNGVKQYTEIIGPN